MNEPISRRVFRDKALARSLLSVSAPQHLFGFFDGTAFLIRALSSLVQVCEDRVGYIHMQSILDPGSRRAQTFCGFFHLNCRIHRSRQPSQAIDSLPGDTDERRRCYSANNPIALGIHLIGHHDLRDARRTQSTKSNRRTQSKNSAQRGRPVLARRGLELGHGP
jgi:hypothetical protein